MNYDQYAREMTWVARGVVGPSNPYFAEIVEAMDEWNEAAKRGGDFYTRPRED